MATYQKFQQYIEDLHHKVHDWSSDTFKVALVAAANAPDLALDAVLADLTEADYTYCSSRVLTLTSSGQTGGTFKQIFEDLIIEAAGGTVGPFRYVVVFNDTSTTPLKPLVSMFDYGADYTIADGGLFKINLDNVAGLFGAV